MSQQLAEKLLSEASASVLTHFFIENGSDRHIIYIHDIIFKSDGGIDIKYSTPSENVDKEWLFNEIQKAIKLIYHEEIEKEKKKSLFSRFKDFFYKR